VRPWGPAPEQEVQKDGLGKLVRAPESAVPGVERAPRGRDGVLEEALVRRAGLAAAGVGLRRAAGEDFPELSPGAGNPAGLLSPSDAADE